MTSIMEWVPVGFAFLTMLAGESFWNVLHRIIINHEYNGVVVGLWRIVLMMVLSLVIFHILVFQFPMNGGSAIRFSDAQPLYLLLGMLASGAGISIFLPTRMLPVSSDREKFVVLQRKTVFMTVAVLVQGLLLLSGEFVHFYTGYLSEDRTWLLDLFYRGRLLALFIPAKYLLAFFLIFRRIRKYPISSRAIALWILLTHFLEWWTFLT